MRLKRGEAKTPTLLDEGLHPAEVLDVVEDVSKSGNDMLVLTLRVEGARFDRMKYYVPLQLEFRVDEIIDTFAPDGDELETDAIPGRRCAARIIHEFYNGEQREKIDGITHLGDLANDAGEDEGF